MPDALETTPLTTMADGNKADYEPFAGYKHTQSHG
jgi:hypothetical protein